VDGTEETGPAVMRTVDWTPMDVYGTYAFVELRESETGIKWAG